MTGVVIDELEAVADGLRHVIADDLASLPDLSLHELLASVDLARRLAEAAEVRVLAAMDSRRSFDDEGAASAARYLAWKHPVPLEDARVYQFCGRRLRTMPWVRTAFESGHITVSHVVSFAHAQNTNPEAFTEAEAEMVGHALALDVRDFRRYIQKWCLAADPDGSLKDAEANFENRKFAFRVAADGCGFPYGQLDPITLEVVTNVWSQIKKELFDADWAEAKAEHGETTCLADLKRTDLQRGADAMRQMAERAAMVDGTLAAKHGKRPLVTVLVGAAVLEGLCETEGGTILDPHEILPLLDRALFERVVFDGTPDHVIDITPKKRLFVGRPRRVVEVRDRECSHPSCHARVTDADIDHIIQVDNGGQTIQINGRVYCKWHHRWRHRTNPPPPPAP